MATRTWRGTTNSNWGTSTNWLEGAVPTSADDVIFDGSSPACTVNVAGVCKTITFSAYTNTITMSNAITISGNVTLGASMTISGASGIAINAAATLTSNGKAFPNQLSFSASATFTLADNWTIGGLLLNATTITMAGGFTLYVGGNISYGSGTITITGNVFIELNGSSPQTVGYNTGSIISTRSFVINSTSTVTFSTTLQYGVPSGFDGLFKYVQGTVTMPTTTQFILRVGQTLYVESKNSLSGNEVKFNSLQYGGANGTTAVLNLNNNTIVKGTLTLGISGTNTCTCNGFKFLIGDGSQVGSLTYGQGGSIYGGTTTLEFSGTGGTGTFTCYSSGTEAAITMPMVFNCGGATVNFSGTSLSYNTGTMTYTAGTINTSTVTLSVAANTTFNISGMKFYNATFKGAGNTITLNSTFEVTNTFLIAPVTTLTLTFAGSAGFIAGAMSCATTNTQLILATSPTYVISSSISCIGTSAAPITFKSSSSGVQAKLTLKFGATQANVYLNGTDIDSSAEQTVWVVNGTLTNTTNWNTGGSAPRTVSNIFF